MEKEAEQRGELPLEDIPQEPKPKAKEAGKTREKLSRTPGSTTVPSTEDGRSKVASSSTPVKTPEVFGPKAPGSEDAVRGKGNGLKGKENEETPKPVSASGLAEGAPESFDLATPPGGQ